MKKNIISYLILIVSVCIWTGCKQDPNYNGGEISPYISNFDLRKLYKGTDVALNTSNMRGANSLKGVVISDHSGLNMPAGLLIIQNSRPVGNIDSLRGIAIPIGTDAANYNPGDSVLVKIEGGVLKRVDGILQITGLANDAVKRVATGRKIPTTQVTTTAILARPSDYESTLVAIVKASIDPLPLPNDTYKGDKLINDGFDDFTLRTEVTATFANATGLYNNANYNGIIFNTVDENGALKPHTRIRTLKDVSKLESTLSAIIISGYMADPQSKSDANYEYIQFVATRDIDFAVTPYAVVTTNNAGSASPVTIFPEKGWATGEMGLPNVQSRTYKFDLNAGVVKKGEFFYVGGSSKLINGEGSNSIAEAKWIKAKNYSSKTTGNGDGFGSYTTNLLANSGNASGIAVFEGTTVDKDTAPIDVIFISDGGSIYNAAGPYGYKIANTDFYDQVNPITLKPQPYFKMGTNTMKLSYQVPADGGFWNMLGGIYDEKIGKWKKARTQSNLKLELTSGLNAIETPATLITKDADGNEIKREEVPPTRLKSQVP